MLYIASFPNFQIAPLCFELFSFIIIWDSSSFWSTIEAAYFWYVCFCFFKFLLQFLNLRLFVVTADVLSIVPAVGCLLCVLAAQCLFLRCNWASSDWFMHAPSIVALFSLTQTLASFSKAENHKGNERGKEKGLPVKNVVLNPKGIHNDWNTDVFWLVREHTLWNSL